jgi:hypothetical protein
VAYFTPPTTYKLISGIGVRATVPDPPDLDYWEEGFSDTDIPIYTWAFNIDDKLYYYRTENGIFSFPDPGFMKQIGFLADWNPDITYDINSFVSYSNPDNPDYSIPTIYKAIMPAGIGESPEERPDLWISYGDSASNITQGDILDSGGEGGDAENNIPDQPVPNSYIPTAEKGAPNGVPTLDQDGLIPNSYLPVDDPALAENYHHVQITPSATWTITHNLNKIPNFIVVNGGNIIEGDVDWNNTNVNTLVITFGGNAIGGDAYLS